MDMHVPQAWYQELSAGVDDSGRPRRDSGRRVKTQDLVAGDRYVHAWTERAVQDVNYGYIADEERSWGALPAVLDKKEEERDDQS
jgi:hypothetical protein